MPRCASHMCQVEIGSVEAISTVSVTDLLMYRTGRVAHGVTSCEQQCPSRDELKPVHPVTSPQGLPCVSHASVSASALKLVQRHNSCLSRQNRSV